MPTVSEHLTNLLSLPRANFEDTATYSAVATNPHGQVSTNAAVVVRSTSLLSALGRGKASVHACLFLHHIHPISLTGYRGDEEPFHSVGLPIGCKYAWVSLSRKMFSDIAER